MPKTNYDVFIGKIIDIAFQLVCPLCIHWKNYMTSILHSIGVHPNPLIAEKHSGRALIRLPRTIFH